MSYLFVVQRTLEMWQKETIRARAEEGPLKETGDFVIPYP